MPLYKSEATYLILHKHFTTRSNQNVNVNDHAWSFKYLQVSLQFIWTCIFIKGFAFADAQPICARLHFRGRNPIVSFCTLFCYFSLLKTDTKMSLSCSLHVETRKTRFLKKRKGLCPHLNKKHDPSN